MKPTKYQSDAMDEIEVCDEQEPEEVPEQDDVPCWGCGVVPGTCGCACDAVDE